MKLSGYKGYVTNIPANIMSVAPELLHFSVPPRARSFRRY